MGDLMQELYIYAVIAFIGGTITSTIITMAIVDSDRIKLKVKRK